MYVSDKRECSMVVCKNDAACQEIEGDYSCSCKEGFAGKNCDRGKTFYLNTANSKKFIQNSK